MQSYKSFKLASVGFFVAILSGCGSGAEPSQQAGQSSACVPAGALEADFFHLVVVPDQVVSSPDFEVQVISESFTGTPLSAPAVTDHSGATAAMTLTTLKWPGTNIDSVSVFTRSVTLVPNQTNTLTVGTGLKTIQFAVTHRSTINVRSATNATELVNLIREAVDGNPEIDVIELGYNESDLGAVFANVGNINNKRTTWLTIRPSIGASATWRRDAGIALRRPKLDFINLSGVVFGGDGSDGGGGEWYVEPGHRVWIDNGQFRAKYKASWPKSEKLTSQYRPDLRSLPSEGQKVYITNSLWDGTAANVAVTNAVLARDLRFNSHRGDFNNFGKVFLNVIAQDVAPIRNHLGTDFLHNDGFQIWGNQGTSNLVFKGLRVESPSVPADLQPFLFDRTFVPEYTNILVDTVQISGANTGLKAQLAGKMSRSRISNISFPLQSLTIRQDFTEPNGSFSPCNVVMASAQLKSVEYLGVGTSLQFRAANVPDANDVSPQLSQISGLAGIEFRSIAVVP